MLEDARDLRDLRDLRAAQEEDGEQERLFLPQVRAELGLDAS